MKPTILTIANILVFVGLVFGASSCNEGGFSGDSAKKDKKGNDALNNGTPFGEDAGDGGDTDGGSNLGTQNDNDVVDNNDNDEIDTDSDQGSDGDLNIETDENIVVFGEQETFHLGNGEFQDSSCSFEISALSTAGKNYFFEFEVTEDTTSVLVKVGKICGVDYPDTNFVRLMKDGVEMENSLLTPLKLSHKFNVKALDRGKYRIEVNAKAGSSFPNAPPDDVDDFVVGEVKIKANKKIVKSDFGAY